jgi:hypothetical protein
MCAEAGGPLAAAAAFGRGTALGLLGGETPEPAPEREWLPNIGAIPLEEF